MKTGAVFVTALLTAIAAAACSGGDDAPGGQGGRGGFAGSGTGGSGGAGGTPVIQDGPYTGWTPEVPAALDEELPGSQRPDTCPEGYDWVTAVRGWTAAPGGEPLPGARAQMCVHFWDGGRPGYVCLPAAESDEHGVFTKEMPESARCIRDAAVRSVLPNSGRATAYCPLGPATDGVLRMRDPILLPHVTPATNLPPLGDADAWREVEFADGLTVNVKPSLYYSDVGTYDDLGAVRVPVDAVGLCGERPGFDGLYAFYREGSVAAPGYGVQIPNESGLPGGARVELLVLGSLDGCQLDDGQVPEAKWAVFGEGSVSGDGTTITSDEGVGLPCLNWFAYREKR